MNELIAMWEARANNENDPKVALAIMQCVGELKATKKPSKYGSFLDAIEKSTCAEVFSHGEDLVSIWHKLNIQKGYSVDDGYFEFTVRPHDFDLMNKILIHLANIDETITLKMHGKVVA